MLTDCSLTWLDTVAGADEHFDGDSRWCQVWWWWKKSSIERAQLDTRLHHSTLDCFYWSNCETFGQITQQTDWNFWNFLRSLWFRYFCFSCLSRDDMFMPICGRDRDLWSHKRLINKLKLHILHEFATNVIEGVMELDKLNSNYNLLYLISRHLTGFAVLLNISWREWAASRRRFALGSCFCSGFSIHTHGTRQRRWQCHVRGPTKKQTSTLQSNRRRVYALFTHENSIK